MEEINNQVNQNLKNLKNLINAKKIFRSISRSEFVLFKIAKKESDVLLKLKLNGRKLSPTNSVKNLVKNLLKNYHEIAN